MDRLWVNKFGVKQTDGNMEAEDKNDLGRMGMM